MHCRRSSACHTAGVLLTLIFGLLALICIGAFFAQRARRKAYEASEPDDGSTDWDV